LTPRTARVSIEGRQDQYLIGPRGLWSAATPEPISTTPEVRLRIIVIDAPGNRFLEDSLWFSVSALIGMLTMQVLDGLLLLSASPRCQRHYLFSPNETFRTLLSASDSDLNPRKCNRCVTTTWKTRIMVNGQETSVESMG